MLLVTFHGGGKGLNNISAFDTSSQKLLTSTALATPDDGGLSELRAMVSANGQLYVASGGKATSQVFCYSLPDSTGTCSYISLVIGPTLSKKGHFETAIAHPFGITFDGSSTCYISNQDTNVVAQVQLADNEGSLGSGSQSAYLNGLFPPPDVFLEGTFVASQQGTLHGVSGSAPDVPADEGGLGVSTDKDGKVLNSVRDVAVANGILFVCDEVGEQINMYALADGTFLGSSTVAGSPTHFAIQNGGLWVIAGHSLFWGQLPDSTTSPTLTLQAVAITPPSGNKIGGISFDGDTVYVPFQAGTGSSSSGGSIVTYDVTQSSPSTLPVLSNQEAFQTLTDTPEFVFFV
ncbi:MAG: hypothetical protein QOJ64_779 [Acidobacteriota bacterium]|jgi:hypothetical protein|nr:hypothetical protein [Acidobacteriota bacterium]